MWSKLYLAVLAISIFVMAFFTYYAWSWLQSVGEPVAAVAGYQYHAGLGWMALWLFAVILLVLANAVLWTSRRGWAAWTTFLFFAVFLVIRYFWLHQAFFQFQKDNGLWDGGLLIAPFSAAILIVLMAAVVFFDQFAIVRLHRKMYPPAVAADSGVETEPTAE